MKPITMWFVLLLLAFVNPAIAAGSVLLDINAHLSRQLAGKPSVPKEKFVTREKQECFERSCPCALLKEPLRSERLVSGENGVAGIMCICSRCTKVKYQERVVVSEPLVAINHAITGVPSLNTDDERMARLPDNTFIKQITKTNCSKNSSLSINETLSFSSSESVSASVRQGVSTTAGVSANLSYKLPSGFGSSLGAQISRTVSLDRTDSQTSSRSITHTAQISDSAGPQRHVEISLLVHETALEVPFRGVVLVDGIVDKNLAGITKVSQVLSESERLIPVNGVLSVTASTESRALKNERSVSVQDCTTSQEGSVSTETFLEYIGSGPNSLTTSRRDAADILSPFRDDKPPRSRKSALHSFIGGTPGNWCYLAPCNQPPDGYRQSCYFDEEGACQDCEDQYDPVCEPLPEARPEVKSGERRRH